MKGSAKTTSKTADKVTYVVEVMKAKEIREGLVAFDMKVNGVSIYGCFYREYKTKEGKEGTMISFPSYQADNGKYYSHAWFPISAELKDEIIAQLQKMV